MLVRVNVHTVTCCSLNQCRGIRCSRKRLAASRYHPRPTAPLPILFHRPATEATGSGELSFGLCGNNTLQYCNGYRQPVQIPSDALMQLEPDRAAAWRSPSALCRPAFCGAASEHVIKPTVPTSSRSPQSNCPGYPAWCACGAV